jgi:hypothetical protein
VRLTTAHRLRKIERAVLALAREPIEPAPNQQVQPRREIVTLEERAPIDLARGKILNLGNLFDEAVAFHNRAGNAQLSNSCYRHFPTRINGLAGSSLLAIEGYSFLRGADAGASFSRGWCSIWRPFGFRGIRLTSDFNCSVAQLPPIRRK